MTNVDRLEHEILSTTVEETKAKTLWINLVSPSSEKIHSVLQSLGLPSDALNQPRSSLQKKIQDVLLLKIEVPSQNLPHSATPYHVTMLTILIKDNKVITILDDESTILMQLEHEYLVKWAKMDVTSFVYRILELTTKGFHLATKEINREIEVIEEKLKTSFSNKTVYELINHNKCFLLFAKSLKRNYNLLTVLQAKSILRADYKQDLILSDLIVETAQAESFARIANNNLSNLMDAYSALIENNLSLSVQYLTIFVTISGIPLAMGGIFGMNTPLPWQDEPWSLTAIAIASVVLITAAISFFKYKKMI